MNKKYMDLALKEAKKAYDIDEIPVGCVIIKDNNIIACGYNCKEKTNNCLKHAEINAIESACKKLGSWRLNGCVIYVTLEPCMMCLGAIIESRIDKIYYGTKNYNEQMYDFNKICRFVDIRNLENTECSTILSDFFKNKRKK